MSLLWIFLTWFRITESRSRIFFTACISHLKGNLEGNLQRPPGVFSTIKRQPSTHDSELRHLASHSFHFYPGEGVTWKQQLMCGTSHPLGCLGATLHIICLCVANSLWVMMKRFNQAEGKRERERDTQRKREERFKVEKLWRDKHKLPCQMCGSELEEQIA